MPNHHIIGHHIHMNGHHIHMKGQYHIHMNGNQAAYGFFESSGLAAAEGLAASSDVDDAILAAEAALLRAAIIIIIGLGIIGIIGIIGILGKAGVAAAGFGSDTSSELSASSASFSIEACSLSLRALGVFRTLTKRLCADLTFADSFAFFGISVSTADATRMHTQSTNRASMTAGWRLQSVCVRGQTG